MASPLPLSERKACRNCAMAKRTCDKQIPSCRRCTSKTLDCEYPTIQRYRRTRPASAPRAGGNEANSVTITPDVDHPPAQAPGKPLNLRDTTSDQNTTDPPAAISPKATIPAACRLWFLDLETWAVCGVGANSCRFNPGPMRMSLNIKGWTASLEDWLRQWIEQGCNPFIHQQLYLDTGLPQCLQDAWATLAAYFSKTARNEHIVLQIIEDRANGLLQEQGDGDASFITVIGLHTIEHLARVQALFIYQFLRLYDGSIRQRALAEKNIPTLLTWCQQLWQSATLDAHDEIQTHRFSELSPFDTRSELTTLLYWKAWVLSESVRRMWLVCYSTSAAYLRERDGWSECTGEIRFTASMGLWDAASSRAWADLICRREPLFIKSLHVDEILSAAKPAEVDSFSTAFMALVVGREVVDNWTASEPPVEDTSMRLEGPNP